jgi:hypothetical protein
MRAMDSSRSERAAARRAAALPGQIVRLGAAKGCIYADLSYEERLAAYWQLIQRAWTASGRTMPAACPRAELPGEVFEIVNDG